MKSLQHILLLFFALFLYNAAFSQSNIVITGEVTDSESGNPKKDVNISLDGTSHGTVTYQSGYYKLSLPKSSKGTIKFSHLGYKPHYVSFSRLEKLAKKDTVRYDVRLVFALDTLQTHVVSAKAKPDTVYGSKKHSVADFEFYEENMILLAYDKTLKKGSKLLYVNEDQVIMDSYYVPDRAKELFRDYMGNINVVCENKVYFVRVDNGTLNLSEIPKDDFNSLMKPCIDTIENIIYFSNFDPSFPAFEYYAYNPEDSSSTKLRYMIDEQLMEFFRAEYKYMSTRAKLEAFRTELRTGIDKEIVGAYMTGFQHSIYYNPLYAPMFVVEDTVMIFDHYKNQLIKYDSDHNPIDSISISYHNTDKKSGWEELLIKDTDNNKIYAAFLRNGIHYIKKVDTQSGATTDSFRLTYKWVENIQIKGDWVYYIYRPFESIQKKFIYKELIRST
jgi:hypothetical protein